MALLSKSLAIASVGISCQTAFQIELQRPLVASLAGEPMDAHATPFDWLLCPVASAVRMINEDCFFPASMDELEGARRPFWPRMGCHFWHAMGDNPERFLGRHRHVAESWNRIADSARKVFIVSNTQNNVERALRQADRAPIATSLAWDDVFRLFAALCRAFGQIELYVVTHDVKPMVTRAVIMPWDDGRIPVTIHRFERDASCWEGNGLAWQGLFREVLK